MRPKIDDLAKTPGLLIAEADIAKAMDAKLPELLTRSAAGEGVMAVLVSMGVNPYAGTDWLRKHHTDKIVAAKKEQLSRAKRA